MNNEIEQYRNKEDDYSYNKLIAFSSSIGGPSPSGCGCKAIDRLFFNKVFFEYYDKYKLTNE